MVKMSNISNQDKRIIKTKKAIRTAFTELLSEKDINEITIKDISDRAIINRKTFYSHYAGIYELVDEIENEIVEMLLNALDGESYIDIAENPYSLFHKLNTVITDHIDRYGFILNNGHNIRLFTKIALRLKDTLKANYLEESGIDEVAFDLSLDYVFAGMLSVYQNWFHSDKSASIEEISELVGTLTFTGLKGLYNEKGSL